MKKIISGKVREVYDLEDGRMVIVTTDRISAFDVILPTMITDKGKVLNALSNFWFDLTKDITKNHMISSDLKDMPAEFQKPEYEGRTILVKKLKMNFGATTLPSFPGMSTPANSFSGVRLAFVSSYTEYPEEAMEFAKFLTSKKMLEVRFAITDQIPPRNDITITDPIISCISEQLKYSKPMPTISQLGTYWQVMGPAISGIWEGDNVSKTMDIVAKQMDAVK